MSTTENTASAQNTQGLFAHPVSPGLARRLAEAAAGYADGSEVYVVACYTPNYDSEDPYDVYACPAPPEKKLPTGYGVFGPFKTIPEDPALQAQAQATVQEFQVTISTTTDTCTFSIDPASQYDALFYTAAAVKKFAVPYYSSLYSGAYGDHVLSAFQAAPVALMAHMPWSEYTAVDVTPGDTPSIGDPACTGDTAYAVEPATTTDPAPPAVVETPVTVAPPVTGPHPAVMEPTDTAGGRGEIPVVFTVDDAGNLRPRPLHPLAGHLRGGTTPQGNQTPRNAGSRAT